MRSSRAADATATTVVAALSAVFISYEVARALRVSFTFDEAATVLVYIKGGFLALFDFNQANNHFLNTLLAKVFSMVGGTHDLVLRLPNLLGYGAYLVFSWLLLKRFVRGTAAVLGFVLLNANPYVLDFFSLCRGYGLSLAFLMASLYSFTLFLPRPGEPGTEADRLRSLTKSLGLAAAGVLCNFTLLDVYCGLVVVSALVLILGRERGGDQRPAEPAARFPGKKAILAFGLLAAGFNILVMSQDTDLSPSLYEPISVRMPGLAPDDVGAVVVKGLDQERNEVLSEIKPEGWTVGGQPEFLTAIHFEIPADVLRAVQALEIRIGPRTFSFAGPDLRARLAGRKKLVFDSDADVSMKRSALPLFKPALNWRGDANHLRLIALRFVLFGGIFVLAVLLAWGAGRFCVRLKLLGREAYWRIAAPTLALGGLIAYPLNMLKSEGGLYWGGHEGIIRDTWTSLVDGSFYGTLYSPHQNLWVGGIAIGAMTLFAGAMAIHARKKSLAGHLPEAVVPMLIVLPALSVVLQNALFHTPFLIGRTALFFLPLSALFLVVSLSFFGKTGRAAKAASVSLLAVAALLSAYHFIRTANTAITVEWRTDADTKQAVSDVERLRSELFPRLATIRLGVDSDFFPSFIYYQRQRGLAWLDVRWYGEREANDLYYLERKFDPDGMVLIRSYPTTGNILVRRKSDQ